jgi:hypothetical protein
MDDNRGPTYTRAVPFPPRKRHRRRRRNPNSHSLQSVVGPQFVRFSRHATLEELRTWPGTRPATSREFTELSTTMAPPDGDQRQLTDSEYASLYPGRH